METNGYQAGLEDAVRLIEEALQIGLNHEKAFECLKMSVEKTIKGSKANAE